MVLVAFSGKKKKKKDNNANDKLSSRSTLIFAEVSHDMQMLIVVIRKLNNNIVSI